MARMRWTLNGRTFDMNGVAPNERLKLDTTEDWEFDNSGGMMTMPHPIHLHGGQFQVVARSTAPGFESAADSVRLGLLDEGLRDTVLVMPDERVKVRTRFDRRRDIAAGRAEGNSCRSRSDRPAPIQLLTACPINPRS